MHEGETAVSPGLATRLVAEQFPQWAGLRLRPVGVAGSDNVMIRLGDELVLRFPRLAGAAAALTVETRWLDWVAGKVPFAVPEVVAAGRPGCGYAHPWAVMRWIAGKDALAAPVDDMAAGRALAGFVAALRGTPLPDGVPVKRENLASRDAFLRQMIGHFQDEADPNLVTRVWETAMALAAWTDSPVLVHADLHPLNLVTRGGTLAAVIDWGAFGAGDPALDLICGWTILEPAGRAEFRQLLAVDDATWARGWAYAFSKAVMAAPYYRDTNPALRRVMLRTLQRCLADRPE
ncbi:MAG: aminoglycoside phosphotransferase family protein [Pseudomonadota bacterium]